jgi:hypothetical protein
MAFQYDNGALIWHCSNIIQERFFYSKFNPDGIVKSRKTVTPAKAGVQNLLIKLDSRLHGNDAEALKKTFTNSSNLNIGARVKSLAFDPELGGLAD